MILASYLFGILFIFSIILLILLFMDLLTRNFKPSLKNCDATSVYYNIRSPHGVELKMSSPIRGFPFHLYDYLNYLPLFSYVYVFDLFSQHVLICDHLWGSVAQSDACSTGDQEIASSRLRSGTIVSLRLIMESFLRSFSPFR